MCVFILQVFISFNLHIGTKAKSLLKIDKFSLLVLGFRSKYDAHAKDMYN